VQGAQALASSWHWKLDPDSVVLKVKLAEEVAIVPDGPLSTVASGATVSTVNARLAADPS
jgi:hypothetical protein